MHRGKSQKNGQHNPCFKFVISLGYVSINILQERINRSYDYSRFGMNPQTLNQTSTTAVEVDKHIDRL